jgi:hypothetical protein
MLSSVSTGWSNESATGALAGEIVHFIRIHAFERLQSAAKVGDVERLEVNGVDQSHSPQIPEARRLRVA